MNNSGKYFEFSEKENLFSNIVREGLISREQAINYWAVEKYINSKSMIKMLFELKISFSDSDNSQTILKS